MRRAHVFMTRVHVWFPRDGECYREKGRERERERTRARTWVKPSRRAKTAGEKTESKRDEYWAA